VSPEQDGEAMTDIDALMAHTIESQLSRVQQGAQEAMDALDALLSVRAVCNGLRGRLSALRGKLDVTNSIQAALRDAHEMYGSARHDHTVFDPECPVCEDRMDEAREVAWDAHLESQYEDKFEPPEAA